MYKNQLGNNFLYLLSEKRVIKWHKSKQYTEVLKKQDESLKNNIPTLDEKPEISNFSKKNYSYWHYSMIRKLSALGYLDIGENKTGETLIQIAPPMLIEMPCIYPSFLLTGARSPDFLKAIKKAVGSFSKIKVKKQNDLPDTVIIEPKSQLTLKNCLEKLTFQGNKMSSYIKISNHPVAWNILEFSGDLKSYEKTLNSHWCSGNLSNIEKIFSIDSFQFKSFNSDSDKLKQDLSLVKISHYENFSKYFLFKKENNDRVKVNLDWGRFLIAKQSKCSVLKYNKQTFELKSSLRLPLLLERGLTLLSSNPPLKKDSLGDYRNIKNRKVKIDQRKAKRVDKNKNSNWTFKGVPYKIARLVADKLGQEFKEL